MPHFKALLGIALCLGLSACVTTSALPLKPVREHRALSFSAPQALDWLNQYRRSKGLSALVLDPRLNAFAQAQANVMAAQKTMSHEIGGDFRDRVKAAHLYGAGENISYGTYTIPDAMRQWQNSPGHNANLLLPHATRFGIAVATSEGRVYWAMVVAGDPPAADALPTIGSGPVVRVLRPAPAANSGLGGLFGN